MADKITKILKIAAYTGIITATAFAVIKGCINKHKKKKMLLIAKQIKCDIKNTERKTSPMYHQKNQEKYNDLWGENNSCKLN